VPQSGDIILVQTGLRSGFTRVSLRPVAVFAAGVRFMLQAGFIGTMSQVASDTLALAVIIQGREGGFYCCTAEMD
jgi:hypothetical protein